MCTQNTTTCSGHDLSGVWRDERYWARDFSTSSDLRIKDGRCVEKSRKRGTVYQLQSDKDDLLGLTCDVTREADVNRTVHDAMRWMGSVDVLVNAAGVNSDALLLKARDEELQLQLDTNLLGTILACRAVVKLMVKQRKGCILNIGSVAGSRGRAGQTVYSASKAGVAGFTRALAREVASRGVTANVIAPGYIETDMTRAAASPPPVDQIPVGRVGTPQEVAELALFLTRAPYITGQVIHIDGGLTS